MNSTKRDALALWVKAVNAKGGFGSWCWDVAFKPAEIHDTCCGTPAARRRSREQMVLSGWTATCTDRDDGAFLGGVNCVCVAVDVEAALPAAGMRRE